MKLVFAYVAIIYVFENLPIAQAIFAAVCIMGIVFIIVKYTEDVSKWQSLVLNALIFVAYSMLLLLTFNHSKIDLIDLFNDVKVVLMEIPS